MILGFHSAKFKNRNNNVESVIFKLTRHTGIIYEASIYSFDNYKHNSLESFCNMTALVQISEWLPELRDQRVKTMLSPYIYKVNQLRDKRRAVRNRIKKENRALESLKIKTERSSYFRSYMFELYFIGFKYAHKVSTAEKKGFKTGMLSAHLFQLTKQRVPDHASKYMFEATNKTGSHCK